MPISDPKAIRALAHPLRLDLLELLTAVGPATAARCGRELGVPQANCSFHLRQLAKYGFVEDAGPGRDRRERTWRVPAAGPALRIGPGDDPVVRRQLERLVVERAMQAILDHAERRESEDPQWRDAQSIVSAVALVTTAEAAELKERWKALLEPYIARARAGGGPPQDAGAQQQRPMRYFMAATPLTALDRGDHGDDTDTDTDA